MIRTRSIVVACCLPLVLSLAPAQAGPVPPNATTVTLRDGTLSFDSKAVTLQLGKDGLATVTWQWETTSTRPHNVRSDDMSFDSHPACGSSTTGVPTGLAQCGYTGMTTFRQTFRKPGTYRYHCVVHGSPRKGMAGTVVVKPAPRGKR